MMDATKPTNDKVRILSAEEEARLALLWIERRDYAARATLLEGLAPLIESFARRLSHQYGLAYNDLRAEGQVAAMEALERLRPGHGRIVGYAKFEIAGAMRDLAYALIAPVRVVRQRSGATGAAAADGAVAGAAGGFRAGRTQATSRPIAVPETVRLDQAIGDNGRATLGDFLVDPVDPHAAAEASHLGRQSSAAVAAALAALPTRTAEVIRRRYLLDPPASRKEVGDEHGLTPERVRQIENEGLRALNCSLTIAGYHARDLIPED